MYTSQNGISFKIRIFYFDPKNNFCMSESKFPQFSHTWEHIGFLIFDEKNNLADPAFVWITNFDQSKYPVFNGSPFSPRKL